MKPYQSFQENLIKDLKDPKFAAAYLNVVLEEGDKKHFLLALRNVLEAQGGMSFMARRTKINRVSLYKMLSEKGNPELGSILLLLRALGVKLQIAPRSNLKMGSKSQRKAA